MQCTQVRELLSPFYDGELPENGRLEIDAHLTTCTECRAELESFQKLSAMASHLQEPNVPPRAWDKLQARLDENLPKSSVTSQPSSVSWQQLLMRATLAAAVLLAAGFWFWHADHNHLAVNFESYLKLFDSDVDAAQAVLLANYHGRSTTLAEATDVLKYEPVVKRGMPEGYTFQAGYLLKMPCCECLEAVYDRPGGGHVAVFEHEKDQPVWFGHRPSIECECGGKPTHLVQVDGSLAATCLFGQRYVTIVGPKSVEEVSAIVRQLAGTVVGRHL